MKENDPLTMSTEPKRPDGLDGGIHQSDLDAGLASLQQSSA